MLLNRAPPNAYLELLLCLAVLLSCCLAVPCSRAVCLFVRWQGFDVCGAAADAGGAVGASMEGCSLGCVRVCGKRDGCMVRDHSLSVIGFQGAASHLCYSRWRAYIVPSQSRLSSFPAFHACACAPARRAGFVPTWREGASVAGP